MEAEGLESPVVLLPAVVLSVLVLLAGNVVGVGGGSGRGVVGMVERCC